MPERMVEVDDNIGRATLRSVACNHSLPHSAETVNSNRKSRETCKSFRADQAECETHV